MNLLELLKADIEQAQELLIQRSDVYNGKRVVIKPLNYLNLIHVWIKNNKETLEFPLNINPLELAKIIIIKLGNSN